MCVTVINVGYGDAILFQLKNGYTALLDGGSALESEFEGDSYRIRSADYLARQQIEHLNAVIISHIHESCMRAGGGITADSGRSSLCSVPGRAFLKRL